MEFRREVVDALDLLNRLQSSIYTTDRDRGATSTGSSDNVVHRRRRHGRSEHHGDRLDEEATTEEDEDEGQEQEQVDHNSHVNDDQTHPSSSPSSTTTTDTMLSLKLSWPLRPLTTQERAALIDGLIKNMERTKVISNGEEHNDPASESDPNRSVAGIAPAAAIPTNRKRRLRGRPLAEQSNTFGGDGIRDCRKRRKVLQPAMLRKIVIHGGLGRGTPDLMGFLLDTYIPKNPALLKLELGSCVIDTDHHARALADVLRSPTCSIQELILINNRLGIDGTIMLATHGIRYNPSITSITVAYSRIGLQGCHALLQAIKHKPNANKFEYLNLEGNNLGYPSSKMITKFLCHQSSLSSLTQERQQEETSSPSSSLRELRFGRNAIGEKGCVEIAIKAMSDNPSLQVLSLSENGCDVGDDTCIEFTNALKHNSSLRILDLSQNKRITSVGVQALTNAIRHINCSIEEIDLTGCGPSTSNATNETETTTVATNADDPFDQLQRICEANVRIKQVYSKLQSKILKMGGIPASLVSLAISQIDSKPDMLFSMIKQHNPLIYPNIK